MRRRSFLQGLSWAFASLVIPSTAHAQSPAAPAPSGRRFIDAHCHFFNAADLPIEGFVQKVALGDFSEAPQKLAALVDGERKWKGLVAWVIDWIVQRRAPTPSVELACLDSHGACPGFGTPKSKSLPDAMLSERAGDAEQDQERLRDLFLREFQTSEPKSVTLAEQSDAERDKQAFLDFVLDEMKAAGEAPQDQSVDRLLENKAEKFAAFDALAEFIISGRSLASRYFNWARLLTSYRSSIIETYKSQYDPQGDRIILATPALVDFNHWLKDHSPAPLIEQIKLMKALSLRQTVPIHGFVPFDPLHQVRRKADELSPLDVVKAAITEHGFIGVKLYPPMGFRPARNSDPDVHFTGYLLQDERTLGEEIDKALHELFVWCASEHVPIMAHTANSQQAGDKFGERANPALWKPVLDEHPDLRLNFSHFGQFGNALDAHGVPDIAAFKDCWEYQIGTLASNPRFPYIFADIGYMPWVLGNWADRVHADAAKALFAEYFQTFDSEAKTILFGTDWSMIAQDHDFEGYLQNVEKFFREVGLDDPQIDNVFFGNSLRFLGLDAGGDMRRRLTDFYSRHQRAVPAFLTQP